MCRSELVSVSIVDPFYAGRKANMETHKVIILDPEDNERKVLTTQEFDSICRICLTSLVNQPCKAIKGEENRISIKALIESYGYVKISYDDELPQYVCLECVAFLTEIHTFRSRCRVNEDLLLKLKNNYDPLQDDAFKATVLDNDLHDAAAQRVVTEINDKRMGIYRCKDCVLIFDNQIDLHKHRMEAKHSRLKGSPCPVCQKLFTSVRLALHMRSHTKEKPFACPLCGNRFTYQANLCRHIKQHKNTALHVCEVCGKKYARWQTLISHQRDAHSVQLETEIFKCSVCDKVCRSRGHLARHKVYHNKHFLCPHCGKTFSTKANLQIHIRVHTGEKPYVCCYCNKSFSQASALKTHSALHTNSRDHKCPYCPKQFISKGNLTVHLRRHTGKTPHRCSVCKKGFCTSSTLKKHLKLHLKSVKEENETNTETNAQVIEDQVQEVLKVECQDTAETISIKVDEPVADVEYIEQEVITDVHDMHEQTVYYAIDGDELHEVTIFN